MVCFIVDVNAVIVCKLLKDFCGKGTLLLGHYLLDSCFSSENFQHGMRAGGSLPLPIIHILSFYYQNLVK